MNTTETATGLIREVLLRSIMAKWIERDIQGVKNLPDGHIWVESMYEPLHIEIVKEMNDIKRTMRSKGIFVIKQHINSRGNCIEIVYKEGGYEHEATYPLATLNVEVKAMVKHVMGSKFKVG